MRSLFPLAVLLASAAIMLGQTFGERTGETRDTSGAVIPGAIVSVTNERTGAVRTASTNQVGVYTFPSLPPGIYDLKVTAQGFSEVTRRGVELQVQQTARIDFMLPLGQV